MDTSTVRLVIFLGMFLVFAGDYSYVLPSIFGRPQEKNVTTQNSATHQRRDVIDETVHDDDEKRVVLRTKPTESENVATRRAKMIATIKNVCLPKLICELTSSVHRDQLSDMERSLLNLIRDTSLSTMAEVPSRYHFAAHMGQLIAGIEGQGCHNFYPTCPLPGSSVLNMMKKVRMR